MTAPIIQKARFKAPAKRLYAIYTEAASHGVVTGGKTVVSQKPGAPFSAFDGELRGATLFAIPGRLFVQRWRSGAWPKSDPDSILTLTFSDDGEDGVIDLVHVNVPEHDLAGVKQGWPDYYWKPLRAYLAAGRKAKS
jgi:activator of HSP90 ATPase